MDHDQAPRDKQTAVPSTSSTRFVPQKTLEQRDDMPQQQHANPGAPQRSPHAELGFPTKTSRLPVADNKPANHKLIDLHATDPRPADRQSPNREGADRDCPQYHSAERQSAGRGGAYPGHSYGGIPQSG